jgi:hypothetical protein
MRKEKKKSDKGSVKLETCPHFCFPKPLPPEPRHEDPDERDEAADVEDFLLDFEIPERTEQGTGHRMQA